MYILSMKMSLLWLKLFIYDVFHNGIGFYFYPDYINRQQNKKCILERAVFYHYPNLKCKQIENVSLSPLW